MGRLTLNVLLSFAQFEREVTSERIRDKIAASKRKGLWVGGIVPLGYATKDRKIVVVEEEAERVRTIFRRYLELGSLNRLMADLRARGIVTKLRVLKTGRAVGGIPFTRGPLAHFLRNRFYIGEVVFKGEVLPGEQPFEWKAIKGQKAKQPYAIAMKDGSPFGIAGIWENWKEPASGEWIRTFAIITTDSNELVAEIHDRMPVILAPADYARWLGEELDPRDLMRPFPADRMRMWPISTRVNKPENDDPSIVEPIEPARMRRRRRTAHSPFWLGGASWIFAAKPFGRPPFCELLAAAGADCR
jgi:SOS response associated peptidase (SRAP)/Recombinase